MGSRYDVELEPEVREWLDTLSLADYRTVEYHADRLAVAPTSLGEPCETAQVDRAITAQQVCEGQHQAATHIYDRKG